MKRNTYESARALRQIDKILALLAERPMTLAELSKGIHMTMTGVYGYLEVLRAEPKRVYVKDFGPPPVRGRRAPIYALGSADDAIEPARKTHAEYYREMKRVDPDRYRLYLDRHSAIARAKRREKYPQTWLSALMPVSAGKSGRTDLTAKHNKPN